MEELANLNANESWTRNKETKGNVGKRGKMRKARGELGLSGQRAITGNILGLLSSECESY